MDHTILEDAIKKVSKRFDADDISLLVRGAQYREVKKGEVLLKDGAVCREFYLVEKGYLRTWYNQNGDMINLNFTFEGDFTTNPTSVFGRHPSEQVIEAGEDSSIWVFNLDRIITEFNSHPQMVLFIRRLAVHILLGMEEHSRLFKLYSPAERYLHIEQHNPRLLQRVSLSQIASYIGVTRETLSRIRGKRQ